MAIFNEVALDRQARSVAKISERKHKFEYRMHRTVTPTIFLSIL
jgi:hypothetical protein